MSPSLLVRLGRAAAVAFCLLLIPVAALAVAPAPFTSMPTPIGVHATQQRLLVTQYCVDQGGVTFFEADAAGNLTPFAPTFPSTGGCLEKYLDISPGLGGFPRGFVYAIQGFTSGYEGTPIFEISPDGSQVRLFATLPELAFDHNGITFDRVGTFQNRLIATTINGSVYAIDAAGAVTFLATTGFQHENPEVVPAGFGPYGGWIWTAAEGLGLIFAFGPNGEVQVVAGGMPGAETVNVIPNDPCTFGNGGGAFFLTSHAEGAVYQYPRTDFAGLGGDVLVTGEVNLVWRIGFDAASGAYTTSIFDPTVRHHEGATFARCPVVKKVDVDVKPQSCPNPLATADRGVLPVAILGNAGFAPDAIDVTTVRLNGVAPLRSNLEDVSAPVAPDAAACACTTAVGDGFRDLMLHFDARAVLATLGTVARGEVVTLAVTGTLRDGTPITGSDCVVVR